MAEKDSTDSNLKLSYIFVCLVGQPMIPSATFPSEQEKPGLAFRITLALLGGDRRARRWARTRVVWEISRTQAAFVCPMVWCFCLFRRS